MILYRVNVSQCMCYTNADVEPLKPRHVVVAQLMEKETSAFNLVSNNCLVITATITEYGSKIRVAKTRDVFKLGPVIRQIHPSV